LVLDESFSVEGALGEVFVGSGVEKLCSGFNRSKKALVAS